jgi:hypothetical protein
MIGLVAAMFLPANPVQQAIGGSPRGPVGEIPRT